MAITMGVRWGKWAQCTVMCRFDSYFPEGPDPPSEEGALQTSISRPLICVWMRLHLGLLLAAGQPGSRRTMVRPRVTDCPGVLLGKVELCSDRVSILLCFSYTPHGTITTAATESITGESRHMALPV